MRRAAVNAKQPRTVGLGALFGAVSMNVRPCVPGAVWLWGQDVVLNMTSVTFGRRLIQRSVKVRQASNQDVRDRTLQCPSHAPVSD